MDAFEGEKDFHFSLNYMESCYLNAAIVDFFHKMRSACESESPVPHMDERYANASSLWEKIENKIPIMDWK